MILYIVIICCSALLITASVTLATGAGFFAVFGLTWFAVLIVILIDGLTATVCRLLPERCANQEKKIFQVSAKEKRFYEKLKIRKWKDKIPEIGQFTGFRKNKIADPKSVEYIYRYLLEVCYGEIGHLVSVFTSFLLLLFFPLSRFWLVVAIPVAFISALLNMPSLFILRYTSYKLKFLRKSNLKRQQKITETV